MNDIPGGPRIFVDESLLQMAQLEVAVRFKLYFESLTVLRQQSREELKRVLSEFRGQNYISVLAVGHCDSRPYSLPGGNDRLSLSRAEVVVELIGRVLKVDWVKTEGKADREPSKEAPVKNTVGARHAKDRRVEVEISGGDFTIGSALWDYVFVDVFNSAREGPGLSGADFYTSSDLRAAKSARERERQLGLVGGRVSLPEMDVVVRVEERGTSLLVSAKGAGGSREVVFDYQGVSDRVLDAWAKTASRCILTAIGEVYVAGGTAAGARRSRRRWVSNSRAKQRSETVRSCHRS